MKFGMAMSEVQRRVPSQAVEIATTVDIGDPGALTLGQHNRSG